MNIKLTIGKMDNLLHLSRNFKARADNLSSVISQMQSEADGDAYSMSVSSPLNDSPRAPTASDKTADNALRLLTNYPELNQCKEELSAIEEVKLQIENAMKSITTRQRYVIRERYFRNPGMKWVHMEINAGDQFEDCSIRTLQRDRIEAIEQLCSIIIMTRKTYNLVVN